MPERVSWADCAASIHPETRLLVATGSETYLEMVASFIGAQPRFLTDAQLLAAFPPGSCFLAEIDGRKELVFVDREQEQRYLAQGDAR